MLIFSFINEWAKSRPIEMSRRVRELKHISNWKMNEAHQFAVYVSPSLISVMKAKYPKFIPQTHVSMCYLFAAANYILSAYTHHPLSEVRKFMYRLMYILKVYININTLMYIFRVTFIPTFIL